MTPETIPIDRIIEADDECRPQENHIGISRDLSCLFEDRATDLVIDHLRKMGTGNPKLAETKKPIMPPLVQRVVESLAVLYTKPPVRRLTVDDTVLDDSDLAAIVAREAFERSNYAAAWAKADAIRVLQKQVVMSFDEDHQEQRIGVGLYEPHQVYRMSSGLRRASLEHDDWILLQLSGKKDDRSKKRNEKELDRFYAWYREGDVWRCWLCDGDGRLLPDDEQPYGLSGVTPYGFLPMVILHDDFSQHPWLPIPESRLSFALSVNSQMNDIDYLMTQEAHSRYVMKSDSTSMPPPESNPGETVQIAIEEDMKVLSASPKISESIEVLEATLQSWAISESIPVEQLTRRRGDMTGEAIIASERDLERRRAQKAPLALRHERLAFRKYRDLYNTFAIGWGESTIPADAEISVSLGRVWQAKNIKEKQEMLFKEVAAGVASMIDYLQEMRGMSRDDAREVFDTIQEDRENYPVMAAQPAGAVVGGSGPNAALGQGSATREPGLFHPDVASSTDGNSVVEAANRATQGNDND